MTGFRQPVRDGQCCGSPPEVQRQRSRVGRVCRAALLLLCCKRDRRCRQEEGHPPQCMRSVNVQAAEDARGARRAHYEVVCGTRPAGQGALHS